MLGGGMNNTVFSNKKSLEAKYKRTRIDFLIVVGFTILNILMTIVGSGFYMLFSLYLPFFLTVLGAIDCNLVIGAEKFEDPLPIAFFIILAVISALILGLYILCFFLSKKHPAWMIIGTVLFCIDSLFLLFFLIVDRDISLLLDVLFHGLFIYQFISGSIAGIKVKKIPDHDPAIVNASAMLFPSCLWQTPNSQCLTIIITIRLLPIPKTENLTIFISSREVRGCFFMFHHYFRSRASSLSVFSLPFLLKED